MKTWELLSRRVICDPVTGDPYLVRWSVLTTPWFGIKVHRILRADWARHRHDHPWWFLSVVVRGGYVEDVLGSHRPVRWVNFKRSGDAHRIVRVEPATWTLVLTGPRRRRWGFYTLDGWVPWDEYIDLGEVAP